MIAPWSMFDYTAVVQPASEAGETIWTGRADRASGRFPGAAGREPLVSIGGGWMTLTATETDEELSGDPSTPLNRQPAIAVNIEIGTIVQGLLAAGDEIRMRRHGMGALSLVLHRDNQLILAFGAICGSLTAREPFFVRDDPRRALQREYELAEWVQRRNAYVVLFDPAIEDTAAFVRRVEALGPQRPLIIGTRQGIPTMSDFPRGMTNRFGSICYVNDPPFSNVDAWRAHLESSPSEEPDDLKLEFVLGKDVVRLGAGEKAILGPYVVRAESVDWDGWAHSAAGVARSSEIADAETLCRILKVRRGLKITSRQQTALPRPSW
jgi:hypothetical protein